MEVNLFYAFVFAYCATAGFGILLQSPYRSVQTSGIIGAIGWVVFVYMTKCLEYDSFYSNFIATIVVAVLSEIFARLTKQPVSIYVIPGVIPLVPGLGMYKGMTTILGNHYEYGMSILMGAAMDAGAIALGMMLVTSIFRFSTLKQEENRIKEIINQQKK